MSDTVRILVADDHALLRQAVKEILGRELDGAVCGEAEDGDQVLAQVDGHHWDLVILDVTMPRRNGLDVLRELRRTRPQLPVLVLSMHPEDQFGKRALIAGAAGYMNKGRHHDVGDHQVGSGVLEQLQPFLAVARFDHGVASVRRSMVRTESSSSIRRIRAMITVGPPADRTVCTEFRVNGC
jgi:DNA-binding NarL/FixJ family response regulator